MHDPMVNESYCETFGWVSKENLARMKELTYKANDVLKKLFDDAGLILVDSSWSLACTKVKWYWAMSSPGRQPPVGQRNTGENGQRPFPPEPRWPDRSL